MHTHVEEHDLSDKELEESYWLVTHWNKIERYVSGSLFFLCVSLGLFVLGSVVFLYGIEYSSSRNLVASLKAQVQKVTPNAGVVPLGVEPPIVLSRGAQGVDIVSRVSNVNAEWRVDANAVFTVDGKELPPVPFFLYPKESKFVMRLGASIASDSTASVRIESASWRRLTRKEIAEIAKKSRFEFSDYQFFASDATHDSSRLVFKLTNTSTYDYWEVPLSVILLSQGEVRAVNKIVVANVAAGDTKTVYVPWFGAVPSVNMYVATSDLDIFDSRTIRPTKEPQQKF